VTRAVVISMEAHLIAKALGAQKYGSGWLAHCPAHKDRNPSLSIDTAENGQVLVYCHASCSQDLVIARLRSLGVWKRNTAFHCGHSAPRQQTRDPSKRALAIWQNAVSAEGSLVETYLASRGIGIAPPLTLRLHDGLKHPSGGRWPAMVGLVTRGPEATPVAIHRTFLARDGSGKAPIDPQKMMLGPCRGGTVRLAPAGEVLMVGEGIETCCAAMQAKGLPAWAALSAAGLPALELPESVREVIVLADGDAAGEAAAHRAAVRWNCEGRRVRIAHAPQGMDFNDMLLGKAPKTGGKSDE
jgi:putative DNA primase/helicase